MKYLNTKPGSLEEVAANLSKYATESEYQDMFKKELEKAGKNIGAMTGAEKKAFFNKIDTKYKAKNEAVKEPYAVGMAAAMKQTGDTPPLKKATITKAHDIAKSIEKDQKKEEVKEEDSVSMKKIDKFHTKLDKLVHKSFGHSSDEKKEEVKETHSFDTNKKNEKQKATGGEKDIIDPAPEMKKESMLDAIKNVWQMSAEELDKIKTEAKYMKSQRMSKYKAEKDEKKKGMADTGSQATTVNTEPNVDYTN